MVQSNIIIGATTAIISSISSAAFAFPVKENGYDHIALEASLNNVGGGNTKLKARAENEQERSVEEGLSRTDSMIALEKLAGKPDNLSTDQTPADIASTFDHDHDHKHFDLDDYIIMAIKEHIKQHQAQQAAAQAQRAQTAQTAQASKLNARDETSGADTEAIDSDNAATFDHDHKHFDLDDYIIMVIKDSIKQHQAQQAAAQAQRAQAAQAAQASKLNARDETSSANPESSEADTAATFDHDHKHFDLDDYIIMMIKEHIKEHQAQQAAAQAQRAQAAQAAQASKLNARDETSGADTEAIDSDNAATFDHDHKHFDLDDYIIMVIKDSIKQHQAQQAAAQAQRAQAAQAAQASKLNARDETSSVNPESAEADTAATFDHDHKHFDLDDYIIMMIKEHIKEHQAQQAAAQAQRAQAAQAAQASKLNARDETSSIDTEAQDSDNAATFDHDHKHFDLDDYIIMVIKDSIKQHQAQQAAAQAQRTQAAQAAQASKLNARDETSSANPESSEADTAATFDHDHKHFDLDDYIIMMIKDSIKQHQAQHAAQVAAQQAQKTAQQSQAVNPRLLL